MNLSVVDPCQTRDQINHIYLLLCLFQWQGGQQESIDCDINLTCIITLDGGIFNLWVSCLTVKRTCLKMDVMESQFWMHNMKSCTKLSTLKWQFSLKMSQDPCQLVLPKKWAIMERNCIGHVMSMGILVSFKLLIM